jgi:hypothetical protein
MSTRTTAKPIRLPVRPGLQLQDHTCGLCSMSAVYRYYGLYPRKLNLRALLGTDYCLPYGLPGRERIEHWMGSLQSTFNGTLPMDLLAVLWRHGFDTEPRTDGYARYRTALRRRLSAGHPALCLMLDCRHWTVVSGWDATGLWISDSVCWEERGTMTYHLSHQEFADLEHGVILLSRTPKASHRPMTNSAYLRQYLRGIGFVAGAIGRNIPRWVGGLLGR